MIQSISAITLDTHVMARSVEFYRALGFELRYGGAEAGFSSFTVGTSYLNVVTAAPETEWSWWGRVIFYVEDVDALYAQAIAQGLRPAAPPRDAEWGERFFHIIDPAGHEISFAHLLAKSPPGG